MVWLYLVFFAGQFETTFHDGLIALSQNNLSVAESQLEAASHLEPHSPRVWLALAQTYWKEHKAPQAASAVQNAENWGANDAVVTNALKVFYSETGESLYFEAAQPYLQQQNFAAALQILDTGRKKFSNSAQLELAAGVAYYGLRRFPEAIQTFLHTIEIDPTIEQPYVFLGRMLDQAEGQLPRITEVLAAFAKRAPESYLSNFLYGKALHMAGNSAAAEALFRKSIAENDSYWESHFELGVLLSQQHKFADAVHEIQRSTELNPKDPAPHYHLARLYDRLGRPAEAKQERELHAKLSAGTAGMAGIK